MGRLFQYRWVKLWAQYSLLVDRARSRIWYHLLYNIKAKFLHINHLSPCMYNMIDEFLRTCPKVRATTAPQTVRISKILTWEANKTKRYPMVSLLVQVIWTQVTEEKWSIIGSSDGRQHNQQDLIRLCRIIVALAFVIELSNFSKATGRKSQPVWHSNPVLHPNKELITQAKSSATSSTQKKTPSLAYTIW